MQRVPVYVRFEQVVVACGFVADVRFLGRTTCVREFGATWMYGVDSGGLAEEGETMQAVYANSRNALTGVFFGLAEEAESFNAFYVAAWSCSEATDDESVREWAGAREAMRAGRDPALDAGHELRRETGNPDPGFAVTEVHTADAVPEIRLGDLRKLLRPFGVQEEDKRRIPKLR